MKILGLIPARGGSRGIPHKNLARVGGKTLLQRAIESAYHTSLSRVVVSTEDDVIATYAGNAGTLVIQRPEELAQDDTPMIEVVRHALDYMDEIDGDYDAVCLLQPTCPLRSWEDIEAAIETLGLEHQSCVSVVDVGEHHPRRMYWDSHGRLVSYSDGDEFARRQDLPPVYLRDGSIYLTRAETIRSGFMLSKHPAYIVTPRERYCNIDTPHDLIIAEALLKNANLLQPAAVA